MKSSEYLEIIIPPLPSPYIYGAGNDTTSEIRVGHAVTVNFNKRFVQGYVISKSKTAPENTAGFVIKNISPEAKNFPAFTAEQLKFFEWIASYYQEPLSNVIDTAVPRYQLARKERIITLNNHDFSPRGNKQKEILNLLKNSETKLTASEINKFVKGGSSAIKSLADNNIISVKDVIPGINLINQDPDFKPTAINLTTDQQKAVDDINQQIQTNNFKSYLVYGVTGSGKTEVYLESIRYALSLGKTALIIVPEIALTPQLIQRFASRLNAPTAVLHSAMPAAVRWQNWQSILEGKARVVIGARSALFAPLENLGIIVVDEEHESSYKQGDGFRYHARDLAVLRARINNIPVVMGSATPALESIYNVQKKKYSLLKLNSRYAATQKNEVLLLDLKSERKAMASSSISNKLKDAIAEALSRREQIFILYNRRGFSAYLECTECGESIKCRNCSITLTWHQAEKQLVCHTCGYHQDMVKTCPSCKSNQERLLQADNTLKLVGAGTEKVHAELQQLFPAAKILRMDRDSVKKFEDYENILTAVRNHQADILVGTQMIAKGHDLPNVTLVGIINSDVGLHIPDFRSSEKVFQLITQASGRAGRSDKPGKVIIQTRNADHPAVKFAACGDFLSFANQELLQRKNLNYPPFCRLLRILLTSKDENVVRNFSQQLGQHIISLQHENKISAVILGPAPAPLEKVKSNYRHHILLKLNSQAEIQKLLHFLSKIKKSSRCRISWDLDPQDLL